MTAFAINETKLRASMCRKSFLHFFQTFWPVVVAEPLSLNWHIQYLCEEIQQVCELVFAGKPKQHDLVINISPGSSKSTIVSQLLPAWCWTRMPSLRWIGGSYSYDLAMRDSLASRDIVQSDIYQDMYPGIQLREDQNTKGMFVNTQMGGRRAVSVGSMVTGYHAHILGIDDPIDPEAAISEADLKKVNRWMTGTLPSRGIHKTDTPMILVQQRLAQNDPSGERLARGGRVKHICIPAELLYDKEGKLAVFVSPPELARKYRDGLMDPKRLSRRNLDEFHKILGAYGYSGQYLQDPVPLSGAMFDISMLKIDEVAPLRFLRLIRAWDKAACLVAGTMIQTALGEVPIEQVKAGDLVPTRKGLRRVEKSWMSKRVDELCSVVFSDGTVLTGTPDHPVACGKEWVWLSKLRPDNIVCHLDERTSSEKLKFLEESSISGSQTGSPGAGGVIFTTPERRPSIRPSGNPSMGVFPVASVSIIRTETGITTRSTIWNAGPNRRTRNSISIARSSERLCASGIEIQRIVKSCVMRNVRLFKSQSGEDAGNAESFSPLGVLTPRCARTSFAGERLIFGAIEGVPVYDLQVEGCPEFYANGILVHNTKDAGAYSAGVLMGMDRGGDYWILDVVRGQWTPTARESIIKQTAQMDAKGAHGRMVGASERDPVHVEVVLEKEGGSGGVESTENSIRNLEGFHAIGKKVTGKKQERAWAFASQVGVKDHVHVLNRDWTHEYVQELRYFPHGKFLDQVDGSSLAFNRMAKPRKVVGGGLLDRK